MATAINSRILWIITLLITIFSLSLPAYAQYIGGTGEPNDPYQIATAEDLMLLGESPEDYDKHFILTADIDLDPNLPGRKIFDKAVIASEHTYEDPEVFGGTSFSGYFDGNGYTISNLTITGYRYLGLFGRLEIGAVISNLGLEAVDVNGTGSYVGGLVGCNLSSEIAECNSSGTINGGLYIGGLVGYNSSDSSISSSSSTGMVRGEWDIGGLVGMNFGNISSSHSTGTVSGTSSFYIGGLVGSNGGSITTSYSTGTVTGYSSVGGLVGGCFVGPATRFVGPEYISSITASYSTSTVIGEKWDVGGLVGENSGFITASYSTGSVSGDQEVGGLVGNNTYGNISSSYSTSAVDGNDYIGGLVGLNAGFGISNSFWDIQASGLTYSYGGTALTTIQMMDPNVYSLNGWAGDPNWVLDSGIDYPRLAWENETGQNIPEPNIDWFDGSGTNEDPYIIATADQLALIGTASILWDKSFILISDLDLSDINISRIGVCGGTDFTGIFDGDNHVISNLNMDSDLITVSYFGLFGYVGRGGELRRINIQNAIIKTGPGSKRVGILAGFNMGNINDCSVTGSVSGGIYCIGGLAGYNSGIIANCCSMASVSGENYSYYIGGLVGRNESQIYRCCAKGSVTGGHGSTSLGGLVGDSSDTSSSIINSYASTSVFGGSMSRYLGGLVGKGINWPDSIVNCYAIGDVSGGDGSLELGGLVGKNSSIWPRPTGEAIIYSFWNIETSGRTTSAGGEGKTTAEMQTASTFLEAGWDFVDETANGTDDVWWIDEGKDYPRLWWENEGN